jgi:hypothetical protein
MFSLILFAALHNPHPQVKAQIPVPVCPPNDPNACHIDQWPEFVGPGIPVPPLPKNPRGGQYF